MGLAASKVGTQTSGYTNNRNNSFTYDAAGNQTNDGLHTYTFNAENQITSMDAGAAAYVYDGEGRRVKKVTSTETTYTFYGPGGVISEFTTSNAIASATAAAGTDKCFYHTADKLGSAVLVMNSSGVVIENNRTLPYGESWLAESTPSTNDKKFTTYQRDSESGLDYASNRYYANTNGRFVSVDRGQMELEVPGSLNRYTYALNDPINMQDPDGNFAIFSGIGKLLGALGKILGIVKSLPPFPGSPGLHFTQVKPDPQWQTRAQEFMALWAAAITAHQEDPTPRHPFLQVTMDCYLKDTAPGQGRLNSTAGYVRYREYEVRDLATGIKMTGPVHVSEQNHVVFAQSGVLGSGNSTWHGGIVSDFIGSPGVVQQFQQFTVDISSGIDATGGPIPVMIRELDGREAGTLNIHSDRNGVIINGDAGKGVGFCPSNIHL
jgi:RHS repeat-associated protein